MDVSKTTFSSIGVGVFKDSSVIETFPILPPICYINLILLPTFQTIQMTLKSLPLTLTFKQRLFFYAITFL